jgi:hypothetical protein
MVFQFYMFFRIHLPGVVGGGRTYRLGFRPSPGWRRGQAGPRKPAPKRARRGERLHTVPLGEFHADEFGPPCGVIAAEVDRGFDGLGGRGLIGWADKSRRDTRDTIATEPLEQPIDARSRDPE